MEERQKGADKAQRKPDNIERKSNRRINHLREETKKAETRSSPFWLDDVDGRRRNEKLHAAGMLVVAGLVAFTFLVVCFSLLVVFCMLTESQDSWLHEKTGQAIDFYRNLTRDNVVREWEWDR